MTSEAQRRANRAQDAARKGKRAALWLELADQKAIDRVMRRERLPSRIATHRFLVERYLAKAKVEE